MKNSCIKYYILQAIIIFLFVLNIFMLNIKSIYIFSGFLTIILLITLLISKYEKDRHPFKKEVFQVTLIYLMLFYLVTYSMGFVVGVQKNGYPFNLNFILTSIIPVGIVIILEEFIRYNLVTKLSHMKINLFFVILTMIALDLFVLMPGYNYSSLDSVTNLFSEIILPIISKNILLTYITYKVGFRTNIFYRFITDLFIVYLIPYLPDLGKYLYGIVNFIAPLVLMLYLYSRFKIDRFEVSVRGNNNVMNVAYIAIIILLVPCVYLISNLGKYTAVVVASNSMQPTINKSDVLIYKKVNRCKDIKVDDVLIFSYENMKLSHRIINISDNGPDKCYIQTKGDNNDSPDAWISTEKNIIGLVEYKISYIGIPTIWLNEMFQKS